MTFRTLVRPLLVALSLAFATTAAAPAFAGDTNGKAAEHRGQKAKHDGKAHGKAEGKGKGKAKADKFPMGADKFTSHVETRLTAAREKLVSALAKHKVAEATRTTILKDFDDGAALVRAAAKRAGKDGEVTKTEAKEVRSLVKTLREQMRAKYAPNKGKKDKPEPKDV